MATTKRKPKPKDPTMFSIRGLTPEMLASLERSIARRKAMMGGGFISQNSAIVGLLSAALATEDETGIVVAKKPTLAAPPTPARTDGT